ncbi:hypothetical protein K439DRAFT_1657822 [Ramaria rubella]|nr:hypothetical protein K439DRAFT_1657822 [Ramaria rubella]
MGMSEWQHISRIIHPFEHEKAPSRVMGKGPEKQPKFPYQTLANTQVPEGWKQYVESDGSPYFMHKKWPVVSSNRITNKRIRRILEETCEDFMHMNARYISTLEDYSIIIDINEDDIDDEDDIGYFPRILEHKNRQVVSFRGRGDKRSIVGEDYYWAFYARYPMCRSGLPVHAQHDVLATLSYFATQLIMGNEATTSPYQLKQCLDLISLYQTLCRKTTERSKFRSEARGWFVSITLREINVKRLKYRYGKTGAITTVHQSESEPSTLLQRTMDGCLLVLCFGIHQRYRERFRRTHTTTGLHVETFQMSLERTLQEWEDSNLLGTVFVLANMSFLSLSSIPMQTRTIVLVSTFFSMASILAGMYLVEKHRLVSEADIDNTWLYLNHATGDSSSIVFTGVFLCVPLVLLIWSILSFFIALMHFALQNYEGMSLGLVILVASVLITIIFCMQVFFHSAWKSPKQSSWAWGLLCGHNISQRKRNTLNCGDIQKC